MATIFYFSGTGNSLSIARGIAKKLDAKLVSIVDAMGGENQKDDVVGIVTPIYFMDIPDIVKKFLRSYDFDKNSYIFTAVTCGADEGIAFNTMSEILKERGLKLSYGYKKALPDNSIAMVTSEAKKKEMLNSQPMDIEKICNDVKQRVSNSKGFKKSIKSYTFGKILKKGFKFFYKIDRKTIDSSKCIKCGTCERVCPVSNIVKKEGIYTIGKECENCFACAQWCPKRAISVGKLIPTNNSQYTHPDVNVKDIANQKLKKD